MIIYPYDDENETYFGVIIHTEISTAVLHKNMEDFINKTTESQIDYHYVIDELSVHHVSDFSTTFMLIIHMYIAHMSKDKNHLKLSLTKLMNEPYLVEKSKTWISSLISISNNGNNCFVPQWLHQISSNTVNPNHISNCSSGEVCKKRKRSNNPPIQAMSLRRRISTNKVPMRPFQSFQSFNNSHVSIHGTERCINPPSASDITNNDPLNLYSIQANIINILNSNPEKRGGIISIFDDALKYQDIHFTKYTVVLRSKSDHNCICAISDEGSCPLSVNDLLSLIEHDWITEETINFMGMVINKNFKEVSHIYPTSFMDSFLKINEDRWEYSFSQVQTWHKDISVGVNFLYIPIHTSRLHWMVCRFDFLSKKISIWNPGNRTENNERYLLAAESYAKFVLDAITPCAESINTRWTNASIVKWSGCWMTQDLSNECPKVDMYDDVGLFTVLNMTLLIHGICLTRASYSQREIFQRKTRLRMAGIIHENIDFENIKMNEFNNY